MGKWCITSITGAGQVASDTIMSLDEFSEEENLECVKAALQRGDDVNTKDEYGNTELISAVLFNHNSVVALLLNTPNIDVNIVDRHGESALHWAVNEYNEYNETLKLLLNVPNLDVNIVNTSGESALHEAVHRHRNEALELLLDVPTIDVNLVNFDGKSAVHHAVSGNNIEALKLLLNVPNINVNIVDNNGCSAVHAAVERNTRDYRECYEEDIEGLKLLLSHPNLTALTLNQKDKSEGETPAMLATRMERCSFRQVVIKALVADPRVDLDTTDGAGRRLTYWEYEILSQCDHPITDGVVYQAKQRREERRRLIREQQRQVSKGLLDGLYDPDSPISKLLGVRMEVMGEIIWQKLVENWQIFLGQ